MPAVQLARLKDQISQLAWHFTRPEEFQKHLHALLDNYADRTYRAGQAVPARPLIQAYHVGPLVLRQLGQDLGRLCTENPAAALSLADLLWTDSYLEPRLLASALLGQTPLTPASAITDRLRAWNSPDLDTLVMEALMNQGSARLRREQPEEWLKLIDAWLSEMDVEMQAVGLKALLPLIQDRSYGNLPRIFRMLGPIVQQAHTQLQAELQMAIEALARRSPAESAYFLRQMVSMSTSPSITRLVRRCLDAFPEESQANLRKAMVSHSEITRGER